MSHSFFEPQLIQPKLFLPGPRLRDLIRRLTAFSSMGLSPPSGSLRPLSVRDPLFTGAVTKRKYHYPLRLLWPTPGATRISLSRNNRSSAFGGVVAHRQPGLELITPTQGTYLLNAYSVLKVHEREKPLSTGSQ